MKTTNLYILSISAKNLVLQSFSEHEAVLCERDGIKAHKPHEVKSMTDFVDAVYPHVECKDLDGFVFTFEIPQLGREFDLLKITQTKALNIELKSQMTTPEKLKKQLLRNRHFLNHLERQILQFVYVDADNEFYKLDGDRLVTADLEEVVSAVKAASEPYVDDLTELFRPSQFLVSPFNTPDKFLNGEYFLTDSQEDIKSRVLERIENKREGEACFVGISGSPGTGKTLLLYDIAKQLANDKTVCIYHCGMVCDGHREINDGIQNLTVKPIKQFNESDIGSSDIVIFDEAHRLYRKQFDRIVERATEVGGTVVFGFDPRQVMSKSEKNAQIGKRIRLIDNIDEHELKTKIRTNKEMASFVQHLLYLNDEREKERYKNVSLSYAVDYAQAQCLLDYYKDMGYSYISFTPSSYKWCKMDMVSHFANTHNVIGQEFDNVVMVLDDTFYYDDNGFLAAKEHPNPDYLYIQLLFQGLTRVREKVALIVIDNPDVFEKILGLLNDVQPQV